MSLLSSSIGRVRCLADEEADHNMLQDLQLAAELGKTLLERNKELENCIKLHQCTIDDQAQEIEYMKKQTAALREVNDSRLKIYEQLEISIQDLERANHRLALENANDKKQIKSQCLTIDTLEARVDDLQKKHDELNSRYEVLLREQQKIQSTPSKKPKGVAVSVAPIVGRTSPVRDRSTRSPAASPKRTSPVEESRIQQLATAMATDEDFSKLMQQLQEARVQRSREQNKVAELREQLDTVLQDNQQMSEQLNVWKVKAQEFKNLEDELSTLEEVRQGHLCGRCLRSTDGRTNDELSMMLDHEEDDELSLAESLADSMRDADTTLQVNYPQACRLPAYPDNDENGGSSSSRSGERLPSRRAFSLSETKLSVCVLLVCGMLSKTLLYHALRTLVQSTLAKLFQPHCQRSLWL